MTELSLLSSLRRLSGATLITALVLSPVLLVDRAAAEQSQQSHMTWIERLGPGVFGDSGRDALAEDRVSYQVNATVLIPLLITSIPLLSRDDVGVGSFSVADLQDGGDVRLRAYEFFAASIPDRARGLNRLGFIREVVKLGNGGAAWTAQFGVISADRAQTRSAAEQSFEQDQTLQPYKIIDAIIEPRRSLSTVTTLTLRGLWESAGALYADVRPLLGTGSPETSHDELENPGGALYDEPLGFLGCVQGSMRRVAATLAEGDDPTRFSCPYIHRGRVFQMEFRDHDIDRRRQTAYREAGLVVPGAVVHRFEYRVVNDEGDEEESFELWTELPSANAGDPLGPPIMPVAFEFRPRSYLELRAVRVAASR